jgi:hypothetical protein
MRKDKRSFAQKTPIVTYVISLKGMKRYSGNRDALTKEVTMGKLTSQQVQKRDLMNDPDARDKIQRMAEEHGMSIEDAQTYYIRQSD